MLDEIIITNEFVTLSVKNFFLRLVVALGTGFLVGLEREHAAIRDKQSSFAGTRTFTLVSLLGFLVALLTGEFGIWLLYICFAGVLLLVGVSYFISSRRGEIGATTEVTLIISFLLGVFTLLGYLQISLAVAVIVLAFLSMKLQFQTIAGVITQEEIFALLKFVVLVALVLPFLPDHTVDPLNVLNPRQVLWVIILTSGLNFGGYLLIKFFGANKGVLLTGFIGGLVSSTAVTWVFSKKSKENQGLSVNYAGAILLASSIMPIRMLLLLYVFNAGLLHKLAIPLILLAFGGILFGFFIIRKKSNSAGSQNEIGSENPLNLIEALKFGVLFILILYLVHFAIYYLGTKGVLFASAFSGLADVDAITISLSKLSDPSMSALIVQNGILLAALSNTFVKMMITLFFGSGQLKRYAAIGYGVVFLLGIVGFFILNFSAQLS